MEAVMPSSTMRINDDTKKDLVKVGAELSVQDGKERSLEDTVKFLIEHYKKSKWTNSFLASVICTQSLDDSK